MFAKQHNWNAGYRPGRSMGGGSTPGHAMRNAYSNPQLHYDDTPGAVQGGLNMGPTPKPKPSPLADPFANLPQFNFQPSGNNLFGALGLPPPPPQPHITSSIPLNEMQQEFLPEDVVQQGMTAQSGKLLQQANAQPIFEQYGATAGNMASATSGQYVPQIMAQMQDPLQQNAMLQGQMPADAALQRYQFGTEGLQAQTGEVTNLAGLANQNYSNQLQAYAQKLNQQQSALSLMFSR